MRLASYLKDGAASYGIVTDSGIVDLASRLGDQAPTLKALLARDLAGAAELSGSTPDFGLDAVTLLPPIPDPGAIWCVGLNTHTHFREAAERMGFKDIPETPMFFLRAANTLVGSGSPIEKPALEPNFDYEGEIAVVIGKRCRNVSVADAAQHIGGFSAFNDGSARQYQIRSHQVTTGKNGYHSAGFGPWLVTADEIPPDRLANDDLVLQTRVNGEVRQNMRLDDLIFSFADLISHISEVTWLEPGDVLVTGSAEGAGALRNPQLFLEAGDVVEVDIAGVGTLSNAVVEQAL